MKKWNKLILLKMGITTLVTLPIFGVISCNKTDNESEDTNQENKPPLNKPNFGNTNPEDSHSISLKAQTLYNNLFGLDKIPGTSQYKNRFLILLQSIENLEEKTVEEVLKIAQENLKNITNEELASVILNSFAKSATKSDHNEVLIDITNVDLNKETNELSFNYLSVDTENKKTKNVIAGSKTFIKLSINKLKIKPDVFKYQDKMFPIISFEIEQPNASIKIIDAWNEHINYNSQFIEEYWNENYKDSQNKPFNTIEDFEKQIQIYLEEQNEQIKIYKNTTEKLGFENGKFTLKLREPFDIKESPFYRLGFNHNNDNTIKATALEIQSPILFSKFDEKDLNLVWEAYQTKNDIS